MGGIVKSIVLGVIGIVLVVIGVVLYVVIDKMVKDALRNELIITSKDQSSYDAFVNGFDDDEGLLFRKIHIMNLTNPVEFSQGLAKPKYNDVGPFVYRHYKDKSNVSFYDDGNRIRYQMKDVYVFQPDMSVQPTDQVKDLIVPNAFYIHFVNVIGGEQNIPGMVMTLVHGTLLKVNMAGLWGTTNLCLPMSPTLSFCGIYNVSMNSMGTAIPMTAAQSTAIVTTLTDPVSLGMLVQTVTVLATPTSTTAQKTAALTAFNNAGIASTWGGISLSNPVVVGAFALYFQHVIAQTNTMMAGFGGKYGNLYREGSVHDIVFGEDPLLALAGMPGARFKTNNSVFSYEGRTGKDDEQYGNMDYMTKVENIETVTVYTEPFSVEGRTGSTRPHISEKKTKGPENIPFYYAVIQRHLNSFKAKDDEEIKGIPVSLYRFDIPKIAAPDPYYNSMIDGFIYVGPVVGGIPIYLSVPHMWFAQEKFQNRIDGQVRDDEEKYQSKVYVELTTGYALYGIRQLQMNIMLNFSNMNYNGFTVPPRGQAGTWTENIQPGEPYELALPIFTDIDYGEVHDDAAKNLKAALVDAPKLRAALLGVFVALGVILIIVGVVLIFVGGGNNKVAPAEEGKGGDAYGKDNDAEHETPGKEGA